MVLRPFAPQRTAIASLWRQSGPGVRYKYGREGIPEDLNPAHGMSRCSKTSVRAPVDAAGGLVQALVAIKAFGLAVDAVLMAAFAALVLCGRLSRLCRGRGPRWLLGFVICIAVVGHVSP